MILDDLLVKIAVLFQDDGQRSRKVGCVVDLPSLRILHGYVRLEDVLESRLRRQAEKPVAKTLGASANPDN